MKITDERVQHVMENAAKIIRFGEDDKPNKYGETEKMAALNALVENGKDFEDADFETNPQAYTITRQTVDASTVLKLRMARAGGFAISLRSI